MINFYGNDADYIHLKFGEMHKCYNFTTEFRNKYPNFCAEYEKYWFGDESCCFQTPLHIAQYVDMYDVPIHFYFNYTDTPAKNICDVYRYLIREYTGTTDYFAGLDGGKCNIKTYKVVRIK